MFSAFFTPGGISPEDTLYLDPHDADGGVLFRYGDEADAAYVVIEGKLEVFRGEGEERVSLATIGPDDVVGEYALVLNEEEATAKRAASVRAVMPTSLARIPKQLFNDRLNELHPMMKRLVHILVTREVALSRKLVAQTSMEE